MLDIKELRNNLEAVCENLKLRGFELDVKKFQDLEERRKQIQVKTQELQSKRNTLSKSIGLKKSKGEDVESLLQEVAMLGDSLKTSEEELKQIQQQLNEILWSIPNTLHESVPIGKSSKDNLEVRQWGIPPKFDFKPKDHTDLGSQLGYMDFEAGAKLSGARFVVLKGPLARLHRALIQFMLDIHTKEHGYEEVYVPYLVNSESLFGTSNLPKFAEDLFHIEGNQDLWLIPTAEVPVTNLARALIFENKDLPKKYVAHTPCFRSEAGSYGRDTRGMIRQHQFEKVEMVQMVKPEDSYETLEQITQDAETILQRLELPYRVVALCSGDIGFGSAKTYDLEVWLPSENTYREISSCSNFEAFQARRMQARYRISTDKTEFIHTLNGSGLAIGRTLIALMENFQDKQGHIHIPHALQPYFDNIETIK